MHTEGQFQYRDSPPSNYGLASQIPVFYDQNFKSLARPQTSNTSRTSNPHPQLPPQNAFVQNRYEDLRLHTISSRPDARQSAGFVRAQPNIMAFNSHPTNLKNHQAIDGGGSQVSNISRKSSYEHEEIKQVRSSQNNFTSNASKIIYSNSQQIPNPPKEKPVLQNKFYDTSYIRKIPSSPSIAPPPISPILAKEHQFIPRGQRFRRKEREYYDPSKFQINIANSYKNSVSTNATFIDNIAEKQIFFKDSNGDQTPSSIKECEVTKEQQKFLLSHISSLEAKIREMERAHEAVVGGLKEKEIVLNQTINNLIKQKIQNDTKSLEVIDKKDIQIQDKNEAYRVMSERVKLQEQENRSLREQEQRIKTQLEQALKNSSEQVDAQQQEILRLQENQSKLKDRINDILKLYSLKDRNHEDEIYSEKDKEQRLKEQIKEILAVSSSNERKHQAEVEEWKNKEIKLKEKFNDFYRQIREKEKEKAVDLSLLQEKYREIEELKKREKGLEQEIRRQGALASELKATIERISSQHTQKLLQKERQLVEANTDIISAQVKIASFEKAINELNERDKRGENQVRNEITLLRVTLEAQNKENANLKEECRRLTDQIRKLAESRTQESKKIAQERRKKLEDFKRLEEENRTKLEQLAKLSSQNKRNTLECGRLREEQRVSLEECTRLREQSKKNAKESRSLNEEALKQGEQCRRLADEIEKCGQEKNLLQESNAKLTEQLKRQNQDSRRLIAINKNLQLSLTDKIRVSESYESICKGKQVLESSLSEKDEVIENNAKDLRRLLSTVEHLEADLKEKATALADSIAGLKQLQESIEEKNKLLSQLTEENAQTLQKKEWLEEECERLKKSTVECVKSFDLQLEIMKQENIKQAHRSRQQQEFLKRSSIGNPSEQAKSSDNFGKEDQIMIAYLQSEVQKYSSRCVEASKEVKRVGDKLNSTLFELNQIYTLLYQANENVVYYKMEVTDLKYRDNCFNDSLQSL